MIREAVYHRSESTWVYPISKDRLRVMLRTGNHDDLKCSIINRERYDLKTKHTITPMRRIGRDQDFTYWRGDIGFPTRRIMYFFSLNSDTGGKLWYGEWGLSSDPQGAGWFQFPMITQGDLLNVPQWARGAVAYQIFPDRFANGDPSNDPEGVYTWHVNPSREVVTHAYTSFGGDLKGIISGLPYLSELGIELIYLTPIFSAPTMHKYDVRDYFKLDPQFGDMEDLRKLVQECSKRGIRIILDGVFNHCGYEFGPFQDVVKNGPASRYWNWFHVKGYPIETEPLPNYEAFAYAPSMPRLNTSNPEVISYFTEVCLYWLREAGVHGWRFDTANEVDPDFWRYLRKAVKREFPDALLMGEIWHDANRWLQGDQFDSVMNYTFRDSVLKFFAERSIDAATFDARVTKMLVMYRRQAQEVNLNLLGSHDTGRFLGYCNNRKERLKLALAFQMTFIGMPIVYYGDEIGMTSEDGMEEGRAPMIWDREFQDRGLFDYVKGLIHLRKRYAALKIGDFRTLSAADGIYSYLRQLGEQNIIVVLNNSTQGGEFSLSIPDEGGAGKVYTELLSQETAQNREGALTTILQPFKAHIYISGG